EERLDFGADRLAPRAIAVQLQLEAGQRGADLRLAVAESHGLERVSHASGTYVLPVTDSGSTLSTRPPRRDPRPIRCSASPPSPAPVRPLRASHRAPGGRSCDSRTSSPPVDARRRSTPRRSLPCAHRTSATIASDAPLADEIRTQRLLDRRPGTGWHHPLGRSAQLPGSQSHASPDVRR